MNVVLDDHWQPVQAAGSGCARNLPRRTRHDDGCPDAKIILLHPVKNNVDTAHQSDEGTLCPYRARELPMFSDMMKVRNAA